MMSFTTLIRRTAAALSAIAALTATGTATAQSITLSGASGNTCTYSSMSVAPNGNFTVSCTSATSPGTFTLSAVTSLPTGTANSAAAIKVTRTGGTTGDVDVNYTVGAPCTALGTSPLTFAGGSLGSQNIEVSTSSTTGTCAIGISTAVAGAMVLGSPKQVKVVDPDADVEFSFAPSQPGTAAVAGSNVSIIVTRTGGTNNAWSVPYTVGGTLAPSGSLLAGALSTLPAAPAGTLSFPQGSSQATLIYNPPDSTPSAPALPATLNITLGTPTTTASTTQQGSVVAPIVHSLTLNGPAVGCPAPETAAKSLGSPGLTTYTALASGVIGTFTLPALTSSRSNSGQFKLSENPDSTPTPPWTYEIHINKCKGLIQPSSTDYCYAISGTVNLHSMIWFAKLAPSGTYSTPAGIAAGKMCYAPASDGPWYINIRYNYPSGCKGKTCAWHAQWQNYYY